MPPPQGWFEFTRQPWFAYLMLTLLQLKVVWRAWDYRDLTAGDTMGYYLWSWAWYQDLNTNFIWSPLYSVFYGLFHFLTADLATATVLHRLAIVFASSILVLALFRRLLPPGIAWLAAAWWAILPINFNTLYEVHLFTILPILMVLLVIQYRASPWARGAALAGLLITAILVRNEMSLGVGLLASVCAVWEFLRWRSPEVVLKPRLMKTLAAYVIPLLITSSIVAVFYERSDYKFPILWLKYSVGKHRVNMAQVFTFGYQQRHPDWKGDPWCGYQDLMRQHFGTELPSFGEMCRANPEAVTEHILWNFSLTPNGLQLLLFNSCWGTDNPDYVSIQTESGLALALSLLLLAIWALGIMLAMRERHFWWKELFRPRLLTLLAMLCIALISIPVIATQRPRPSYLFSLSVFLMALTGIWVTVIVQRFAFVKRLSALMPGVMLAFCLLVPSYYMNAAHQPPQLLNQAMNRLKPYQFLMARTDPSGRLQNCDIVQENTMSRNPTGSRPCFGECGRDTNAKDGFCAKCRGRSYALGNSGTRFLKGTCAGEICFYLAHGHCQCLDYGILSKRSKGQSLESFLEAEDIALFYLDEQLLTELAATDAAGAEPFLGEVGNASWKWIGGQNLTGDRWKLFQRRPEVTLGNGWYGLEHAPDGAPFRWVHKDAELSLTPRESATALLLDVEPGPGLASRPGELTVTDKSGQILAAATLAGRQQLRVPLPAEGRKNLQVRLSITNGGTSLPTDPRILNFRVFRAELTVEDAKTLHDIAGSDIILIGGWHALEGEREGQPYRWVDNDAELTLNPREGATTLLLDIEPGPGLASRPGELTVADKSGQILAALTPMGKQQLRVPLPAEGRKNLQVRLHITNGGTPTPGEARILNFRVFGADLTAEDTKTRHDIGGAGIILKGGWHALEGGQQDQRFRWVDNDAQLLLNSPDHAKALVLEVEPGPGLAGRPGELTVTDESGKVLATQTPTGRQQLRVPLPAEGRKNLQLRLHINNGGTPTPGETRILNFRVFRAEWSAEDAPSPVE